MSVKVLLLIMFSYFIGCFNTGYYYVKYYYNKDIRYIGSFATGATNVSRVAGRKGFIITATGDVLKGVIVIGMAKYFNLNYIYTEVCLLFVILGHISPIQLGFKGGKGIAVLLGGLLFLNYKLIIILLINILILMVIFRNYKISGLVALIALAIEYTCYNKNVENILLFYLIITLVIFAHRVNIKTYLYKE